MVGLACASTILPSTVYGQNMATVPWDRNFRRYQNEHGQVFIEAIDITLGQDFFPSKADVIVRCETAYMPSSVVTKSSTSTRKALS